MKITTDIANELSYEIFDRMTDEQYEMLKLKCSCSHCLDLDNEGGLYPHCHHFGVCGTDQIAKELINMNQVKEYIKEHKEDLNEEVTIWKGGDAKTKKRVKIGTINAYHLVCKLVNGGASDDEVATLHKVDGLNSTRLVNEFIKSLTSENAPFSLETKHKINMNMFNRGAPSEISPEVDQKYKRTAAEEVREFNRLLTEGVCRPKVKYINKSGDVVTLRSWALIDPNYDYEKGDMFFIVTEDEAEYFMKHGHFPLRTDYDNVKLGKKWIYFAFELANLCSGEAHKGCQCPSFCYAKRMENFYKNVRDRVLKFANAWANHTMEQKLDFYEKWIMTQPKRLERNGVRFCDTGDVTNQELLDEIFEFVRLMSDRLRARGIDVNGRFYIYSTRADLDWSNKPDELILNASNFALFKKVPDANWFRVVNSFDDIPDAIAETLEKEGYEITMDMIRICNCNCKSCDYCAVCRNKVIIEVLG